MCSNFFLAKAKRYYIIQNFFRSERERFGSIMNFVSKFFEIIETFCICKKEVGTHQKVLVLFQNFWNKQKRSTLGSGTHQKRFGFVSILSFDIGTFVLSFLSVSGSGSTLPDPDPLVRGRDPDPDPNPSTRLLQKSEYTSLSLRGCESVSRGRQFYRSMQKLCSRHLLRESKTF